MPVVDCISPLYGSACHLLRAPPMDEWAPEENHDANGHGDLMSVAGSELIRGQPWSAQRVGEDPFGHVTLGACFKVEVEVLPLY